MSDNKDEATFYGGQDEATYHGGYRADWNPAPMARYGAAPLPPQGRPIVSPGPAPWAAHPYDGRPNSTVAVWALITGVVGILAGWCMFGLPSIAAIILGHVGMSQTKSDQVKGRGMAVAGLVLGYVAFIPAMIFTIWMIVGGAAGMVTPVPEPSGLTTSP